MRTYTTRRHMDQLDDGAEERLKLMRKCMPIKKETDGGDIYLTETPRSIKSEKIGASLSRHRGSNGRGRCKGRVALVLYPFSYVHNLPLAIRRIERGRRVSGELFYSSFPDRLLGQR